MKKYANLTAKDMSDSGQALVLLCLIAFLLWGGWWLWAGMAFLILNMANPNVYKGWAFVWLNFAHVLGIVVSHVILTLEFFLLVLPIGLVRRRMGKDAMDLKKWRQGDESVFVDRNHTYTAEDLKNPY